MTEVSFGEWLKRQRMGKGPTREQLAHQIGCATITLRKIESEERHPSAQIVDRLAEIFDIPQTERINFSHYARGDWEFAPRENISEAPWQIKKLPRTNLPATVTELIGRAQELSEVVGYLKRADVRLVTLIGPPGIGKTRLGLEAARVALPDFQDGVFFIALAPLENSKLIAPTIAQTLGFAEVGGKSALEHLQEGIGQKQMLLLMDNCEHLIEEVAFLVSQLLSACPRLKVLTTSRETLRVSGEWIYSVPALNVPKDKSSLDIESAESSSALRLFAERARAVNPNFLLNRNNIQVVAGICAQLDGLPLAIELIAARIRLMSPESLLARLNDQFALYADGMRAPSDRQRTLNNAIGWSFDLLSEEEQKLFVRLSVFSGGFTLEAAEAFFHDPLQISLWLNSSHSF